METDFLQPVLQLEEKIEQLKERFINEEIKADLYHKFSEKFGQEMDETKQYLENTGYSTSNLENYVERSLQYVLELPSLWASSNYVEKRKIQFRVFPNGFYYDRKNDQPRTTKMNSVFSLIARLKGNTEEQKTGTSEIVLKNSGWVAPVGSYLYYWYSIFYMKTVNNLIFSVLVNQAL